jgi:hypothetical protein
MGRPYQNTLMSGFGDVVPRTRVFPISFSRQTITHYQHVNPSIPAACQLKTTKAMSHCHDEHEHHGHDHSEGAVHDHTDDITPALQNHIYQQIDFSAINTLNESESRSGSKVVQKAWSERLNEEPELKSDADEQLLMHIP